MRGRAAFKICGLTRPRDAAAAAEAGASYGGVILAHGSPRTLEPARAREVFGDTGLTRCGVFVNASLEAVLAAARALALDVLQLHGDEDAGFVERAREESGLEVWKAVRPREADEFSAAVDQYGAAADGLLLDGWSAVARGGTGTPFPWDEVAARREYLPGGVRLIVAGGLTPANVGEVIAVLAPDVVDVSSGVESAPGVKDARLVRAFAEAVHAAFPPRRPADTGDPGGNARMLSSGAPHRGYRGADELRGGDRGSFADAQDEKGGSA
ncbi:MAG TPA: hypothetical protein VMN39_12240 [Longimicrobiaceae bacterium]|nr:hypothetical protein [Longimicrobiaceae bacterium]